MADVNTTVSAIAALTNSSDVAIRACNWLGATVQAGTHLTIPTPFGIGFFVTLLVLTIVPPVAVGLGRWFGSKDEARQHGVHDT